MKRRKDSKRGGEKVFVKAQTATWELFQMLDSRAPVRVAPTVLFDSRGVMQSWLWTKTLVSKRKRKLVSSIQRYPKKKLNLLGLFSEWEERAKHVGMEDAICVQAIGERFACCDRSAFSKLIKTLARQEADVCADTYEPWNPAFLKGPFFLQATVPTRDDLMYISEFNMSMDLSKSGDTFSSKAVPYMSSFVAARSSESSGEERDEESQEHEGGKPLEDESTTTAYFNQANVTLAQQETLRDEVNALIEYFERTQHRTVFTLTTFHVLAQDGSGWLLLYVANLCHGPSIHRPSQVSKTSLSKDNEVEQQAVELMASEEPPILKEEEDRNAKEEKRVKNTRNTRPQSATTMREKSKRSEQRVPFLPTSAKPSELRKDDKFLLLSLDTSIQCDHVPETDFMEEKLDTWLRKQIGEKAFHTEKTPKPCRSIEHTEIAQKLTDARQYLSFLVRKVQALEASVREDQRQLRVADERVRAMQESTRIKDEAREKLEKILHSRMEEVERMQKALASENESLRMHLETESMKRKGTLHKLEKVESNFGVTIATCARMLQDALGEQACSETTTLQGKLEAVITRFQQEKRENKERKDQVQVLQEEVRKLNKMLEQEKSFRSSCFHFLADPSTPGVTPPARKRGQLALPTPSATNVRVVVRALVEGSFETSTQSDSSSEASKKSQSKRKNQNVSVQGVRGVQGMSAAKTRLQKHFQRETGS